MLVHRIETPLPQCNLKFASNTGEFEGYASVFGSNDSVNDTIAKGAFAKSLESGRKPAMFINHDHKSIPVGDWVEMKEDDQGLFAIGRIDMNHKDGPTLYSAMKRGAMTGLSIGFTMGPEDFQRKSDGGRLITNVILKETSVVTFPCEDGARIATVKSEIEAIQTIRDCETFLREAGGMSRKMAEAFLGHVKDLLRGEPAEELKDEINALRQELAHTKSRLAAELLIKRINSL